jgi:hypothetical protein
MVSLNENETDWRRLKNGGRSHADHRPAAMVTNTLMIDGCSRLIVKVQRQE